MRQKVTRRNRGKRARKTLSAFERFVEFMAWIQIIASPLLMGCITGLALYIWLSAPFGLILGVTLPLAGLVVGIAWATRIRKKAGTSQFISRIMGTPGLEKDKAGSTP